MATTLSYNGYTGLTNIDIDSWETTPVHAEDGLTVETYKHVLEGTASISAASGAAFKTTLDNARARLLRTNGELTFTVDGTTFISVTAPDEHGGPIGQFKITEMSGALFALVSFRIEFHKFELISGESLNANGFLSHRWTQRFNIDAMGTITHTVTGVLRVAQNISAAGAGVNNTGSNPDAWRLAVTPVLPQGFRRETFDWAESEDRTKLIYTCVSKQYHRDIPAPALFGEGSFTFRRSIDSGSGMIGTKVFACELAGNKNSSAASLFLAAINVSKKYIVYTGAGADLITSMEVEESSIFTENRVRVTITAKAVGAALGNAIQPANVRLGQNPVDGLTGYSDQSPYGSSLVRAVRRSLSSPTNTSVSRAQVEEAGGGVVETGYQATDAAFEELETTLIPTSETTALLSGQHLLYPIIEFRSSIRLKIRTGMVVMPSQSLTGNDAAYQTGKPVVMLEEEVEVRRIGSFPERYLFAPVPGAVVLENDSSGGAAGQDAAGNFIFQARHYRLSRIMDLGQTAWDTSNGGIYRRYWPEFVSAPYDPRISDTDPRAYTAYDTTPFYLYPLNAADDLVN